MKKRLFIIVLFLLSINLSADQGLIRIIVKKTYEAKQSVIHFYDILDTKRMSIEDLERLPNFEITKITKLDYQKIYDAANVIPDLINIGLNVTILGDSKTLIKMGHQTLKGSDILQGAMEFIEKEYQNIEFDGKKDFSFTYEIKDINIPVGFYNINYMFANSNRKGNVIINAEILVDGKLYTRKAITVYVEVKKEVYKSSSAVRAKSEIDKSDLLLVELDVSQIRGVPVTDLEQLDGKRARTHIRANTVLTESLLENIPLVHLNSEVTVIYETDRVKISTTGIAKQRGGLGDLVRIRTNNDKYLKCKVISSNTVLANF